jgi:hypothetical protein
LPPPTLTPAPAPGQLSSTHPNLSSAAAILPTAGPWEVTRGWCDYDTNYPRPQGSKGLGLAPSTLGHSVPRHITPTQSHNAFPRPLGSLIAENIPVIVEASWSMTDGSQTSSGHLWFLTTLQATPNAAGKMRLSNWDIAGYGWFYRPTFAVQPGNHSPVLPAPSGAHHAQ